MHTLLHCEISTVAVEDLNLNAVESLRGAPYLAIGKHLCGPATGNCCTYAISMQL